MSHRVFVGLASLLLVFGLNTAVFAQVKPHHHVKHPVKVKKVKKHNHRHHRGR